VTSATRQVNCRLQQSTDKPCPLVRTEQCTHTHTQFHKQFVPRQNAISFQSNALDEWALFIKHVSLKTRLLKVTDRPHIGMWYILMRSRTDVAQSVHWVVTGRTIGFDSRHRQNFQPILDLPRLLSGESRCEPPFTVEEKNIWSVASTK
jgi:hypothetical protein